METYIIIYYAAFVGISVLLTIWVGKVLYTNGAVFLKDIAGNEVLANSINKMLLTGFYLINIGYVLYMAKTYGNIETTRRLLEMLTTKIGTISLLLGVVHYLNMFVLYRLRKRIRTEAEDERFLYGDTEDVGYGKA